mmetsp:Transcript_50050/g.160883  ORF Transcript_50050/g.160883 Transcript_50050/m.160883 type:complete len:200 (-) Transcript_50050:1265-1864(-)
MLPKVHRGLRCICLKVLVQRGLRCICLKVLAHPEGPVGTERDRAIAMRSRNRPLGQAPQSFVVLLCLFRCSRQYVVGLFSIALGFDLTSTLPSTLRAAALVYFRFFLSQSPEPLFVDILVHNESQEIRAAPLDENSVLRSIAVDISTHGVLFPSVETSLLICTDGVDLHQHVLLGPSVADLTCSCHHGLTIEAVVLVVL